MIVMAQATPMFEMKMKEEKNLLLACIINNDIRPSRAHIKYYLPIRRLKTPFYSLAIILQ